MFVVRSGVRTDWLLSRAAFACKPTFVGIPFRGGVLRPLLAIIIIAVVFLVLGGENGQLRDEPAVSRCSVFVYCLIRACVQ